MTPKPVNGYSIAKGSFHTIRLFLSNKIRVLIVILCAGIVTSCITIDQLLSHSDQKIPNVAHEDCINCQNKSGTGDECLICHPDYKKNHHPINFTPPEFDLVHVDKNKFPLFDGKIQCFTCHTADGMQNAGNDKLLRGGPYSENRQLCFQCHYKDKYSEIDVHLMHEKNGSYRVIYGKLVCTFCHPQNINNLYTTDTVEFKADISFLCLRCHPEMSSPHIRLHFNKVPPEKMKNKIEAFEKKYNVILPLVPKGRITCATCHNPHQKGVLVDEKAMAGADSHYRLRTEKNLLCYGCHL
jgi:predicted CXXCH cytochrome family protein